MGIYSRVYRKLGKRGITESSNEINIDNFRAFLTELRAWEAQGLRLASNRTERVYLNRNVYIKKDDVRLTYIRERTEWLFGDIMLSKNGFIRNLFLKNNYTFPVDLLLKSKVCPDLTRIRATETDLQEALKGSSSIQYQNGRILLQRPYNLGDEPLDFQSDLIHVKMNLSQVPLELSRDRLKLGTLEWKSRYYKEKFGIASGELIPHDTKPICEAYMQTILWVYAYYLNGLPSWSWYYPYHYPPLVDDLHNVENSCFRKQFRSDSPISPSAQFLSVSPKNVVTQVTSDLPEKEI